MSASPRYITNEKGERTEVILPIATYEALLEDLKDLAAVADRRNEDTIAHLDFVAELEDSSSSTRELAPRTQRLAGVAPNADFESHIEHLEKKHS